jgi:DNA-binding MarR family transcriptional regulator
VLWSGRVHAIAFGAKRVFHSFLRVTRKPLLSWPGLTGARFDLLSAFLEGEYTRPACVELRQSELRAKLGVCASVVSRMLRALHERGWIARQREPQDRRTWRLSLTPAGEQVIRAARRLLLRALERIVHGIIVPPWLRGPAHRFAALLECTQHLEAIRYHLADRATLEYLWWHTPFDR